MNNNNESDDDEDNVPETQQLFANEKKKDIEDQEKLCRIGWQVRTTNQWIVNIRLNKMHSYI